MVGQISPSCKGLPGSNKKLLQQYEDALSNAKTQADMDNANNTAYSEILKEPCTKNKCRKDYDSCKSSWEILKATQLVSDGKITVEEVNQELEEIFKSFNNAPPESQSILTKIKNKIVKIKKLITEPGELTSEQISVIEEELRTIKDEILKGGISVIESFPGGKFIMASIYVVISKLLSLLIAKVKDEKTNMVLTQMKKLFEILKNTAVEYDVAKLQDEHEKLKEVVYKNIDKLAEGAGAGEAAAAAGGSGKSRRKTKKLRKTKKSRKKSKKYKK